MGVAYRALFLKLESQLPAVDRYRHILMPSLTLNHCLERIILFIISGLYVNNKTSLVFSIVETESEDEACERNCEGGCRVGSL